MRHLVAVVTLCWALLPVGARAQTLEEHIALGDSLHDALLPAEALEHYRAALVLDSTNYEALWKFVRSQVDVAKQIKDNGPTELRDSLYEVAGRYAEAAVAANPEGADGHFVLALALGRLSRTKGGRERVQFGKEIYDAAARAIELDPSHDGAEHVLGAWHAEIRRLSGITRFLAKTLLGGGYMGRASWDSAIVHLQRAVELRPEHIYHRVELAEVYLDLDRFAEARHYLEPVVDLPPVTDVLDPEHKKRAAELLAEIRRRTGR
ncbi:MAG: tetratricopeptide repeat protein [Gemmatimonadales bacterium]